MTPVSLGPPSGQFVLRGLNWQFQFAPVTSLMISGLPALDPVLPLLLLLLPQAAAAVSRLTAPIATPIDLRRIMCCLALQGRVLPVWSGRAGRVGAGA